MTSLTGESVRLYPMPVWLALEQRVAQMPSAHPARVKFFDRVNYFGLEAELDTQGRVIIPPRLRDVAQVTGDVDVIGMHSYLDVWNHERFVARMASDPYTADDAKELAGFGV